MLAGREVIEEHPFREQAKKLFGSDQTADLALGGVISALARDLYKGQYPLIAEVDGRELYAIKTETTPAFKSFIVIFSIERDRGVERACLWDISWSPDADAAE